MGDSSAYTWGPVSFVYIKMSSGAQLAKALERDIEETRPRETISLLRSLVDESSVMRVVMIDMRAALSKTCRCFAVTRKDRSKPGTDFRRKISS